MSMPNDLLAEAVAGLLARIPEKWEPVPSDLSDHEKQALVALIAAGLVERRITFSIRLPGQQERAIIAIEITGEGGLAEAMEGALQELWLRWGKRWAELRGEVGSPKHIIETKEDYWRLSSHGKIAKEDLESEDPLNRRCPIDFVLRRGFFDGAPKLMPDGRIVRREPVRGYGRLLRCQIENAPSGSLGVEVNNWQAGAEAFAKAFERFLQNLGSSPAPSPASGQAEPAKEKKRRGRKADYAQVEYEKKILAQWISFCQKKRKRGERPTKKDFSKEIGLKTKEVEAIIKRAKMRESRPLSE